MFFRFKNTIQNFSITSSPPGIDFKTFSTFSSVRLFTCSHARDHVYVLIFVRNLKNTVTHVVMECSMAMCSVVECSSDVIIQYDSTVYQRS